MSACVEIRSSLRRPAQLTILEKLPKSKPQRIPASPSNAGCIAHTAHTAYYSNIHGSPESASPLRAPIRFIASDSWPSMNVGRQPPVSIGPWRPYKLFTRFISCNPLNMAAVHPGDEVYFSSISSKTKAMANAYITQRLSKAFVFTFNETTGEWAASC